MRLIAIAAAGLLLASANLVSATQPNSIPEVNTTPIQLAQTSPQNQKAAPADSQKAATEKEKKAAPKAAPMKDETKKKDDTAMQKVKRTWRRWTTPSHTFCVRTPIPIPLTSKTCTARARPSRKRARPA
jgi:hypothetical protein